jgi:hypothetical protein
VEIIHRLGRRYKYAPPPEAGARCCGTEICGARGTGDHTSGWQFFPYRRIPEHSGDSQVSVRHNPFDLVSLKHCAGTIAAMGNYVKGLTARDSRRELRRRRLRVLGNAGLAALAVVTAVVLWMALQR